MAAQTHHAPAASHALDPAGSPAADSSGDGASPQPERRLSLQLAERPVTIYRLFFLGGILAVLTGGATWGMWLLWRIGFAGTFTALPVFEINAHGHVQIYGWVGLFVMGFAYQAFPRVWKTKLARPRLAIAAFIALVVGMILKTAALYAAGESSTVTFTALIGGLLETAAVTVFAVQMIETFRRSGAALTPFTGYAFASIAWFVIATVGGVWYAWATMSAPTREVLLHYVSTYQAPLRDIQIHGLALLMILGVSMQILPGIFGVPRPGARRAWAALWIINAAVVAEVGFLIAYQLTGVHALAGGLYLAWIALATGVAIVAAGFRFWRPMPRPDRSGKFIRAAYAWLGVSLVMLLAFPLYQWASDIAFSHAYYGAIRHAVTVGFISLMIMGVGAKVAANLNGIDTRVLGSLWGPFLLVNVGCFLRVSTQTLTDWAPGFFKIVGVSGTLEVAGLAWWGAGIAMIILRPHRWWQRSLDLADAESARSCGCTSHDHPAPDRDRPRGACCPSCG